MALLGTKRTPTTCCPECLPEAELAPMLEPPLRIGNSQLMALLAG